jgi:hypothetical protein
MVHNEIRFRVEFTIEGSNSRIYESGTGYGKNGRSQRTRYGKLRVLP